MLARHHPREPFPAIQHRRHEQALDEYRKVLATVEADKPDLPRGCNIFHDEADGPAQFPIVRPRALGKRRG